MKGLLIFARPNCRVTNSGINIMFNSHCYRKVTNSGIKTLDSLCYCKVTYSGIKTLFNSLCSCNLGLNKVCSFDIVVHLKQNTISYTTSQTAYMSTALTLNTQNYRYKFTNLQRLQTVESRHCLTVSAKGCNTYA